jgi:hypothetical protein
MSKVCAMCGMACGPADYHPYAACLMFMACHDSETVRANLAAVLAAGEATRPAPNATDRPVQAAQTAAQEDYTYPRDLFAGVIDSNSPYAFYLFQWVPYQTEAKRWRLKMKHDVRTFDGREAFGIWPNGTSCGPFRDDEVEFIRISRKQWGDEWKDPRPAAAPLPTPKEAL